VGRAKFATSGVIPVVKASLRAVGDSHDIILKTLIHLNRRHLNRRRD
jgi:hypothetical protein